MSLFNLFQSKKKKTILFVEDEQEMVEQYKILIGSDKELNDRFDFLFATNKEELRTLFNKADAVISDYYMGSLKFEEVWIACENKKPLTLVSGEIKKIWSGPTAYKPMTFKTFKKAILNMMDSGAKAPTYIKKSTKMAA